MPLILKRGSPAVVAVSFCRMMVLFSLPTFFAILHTPKQQEKTVFATILAILYCTKLYFELTTGAQKNTRKRSVDTGPDKVQQYETYPEKDVRQVCI